MNWWFLKTSRLKIWWKFNFINHAFISFSIIIANYTWTPFWVENLANVLELACHVWVNKGHLETFFIFTVNNIITSITTTITSVIIITWVNEGDLERGVDGDVLDKFPVWKITREFKEICILFTLSGTFGLVKGLEVFLGRRVDLNLQSQP